MLRRAMMAGNSGPVGNFPARLSLTPTIVAAATAHNVAMPATVNAGDLLVVLICTSTTSAMTTPTGWTLIGTATNVIRAGAYYKVAAGSEGGTTVNFPTGGSTTASAQVIQYQAGTYSGTPSVSTAATGSSTAPDPSTVTPGAGAGDYEWLAFAGAAGAVVQSVTGFPLASGQTSNSLPNSSTPVCASCYEHAAGSSRNPGAFTLGTSALWVAWSVAIKGT